ncbi:MAG: ATP-binding protein [Armatimonadota bacterium]
MIDTTEKKYTEPKLWLLLGIIILAIIICDILIMLFIRYLPYPVWIELGIDSGLLVITLFPALYFFMILPFKKQIKERKEADKELQKAREEFLSMLIHDLKTPLSTIIATTDLLPRLEGNEKLSCIEGMRFSENALLYMVNNVTGAAKIDSGKSDYHFENFEVENLFQELNYIFKPYADFKQVNLTFSGGKDTTVHADYDKLRHIFYNLVNNALRYTPMGGTIKISCRRHKDKAAFEVSDTGCGIPQEKQQDVFKKFTRIKGQRSEGTGLGLYIVKTYLEGHASEIKLESGIEQGTKFTFRLPLA